MSTVTDPVMLDSTGQIIVSKLQDVIDAINGGTIDPLTVTQNGTYTPSGTTLGYGPVTVDVQGGGSIPLLTRAQWDALSTAQKQAYGLLAIQDANSGFDRGELVYGADYLPIGMYLPASNTSDILCEAYVDVFSSSESWGAGEHPIIMDSGLNPTKDAQENAVYLGVAAAKKFAYVDLGAVKATYTAYAVMKLVSPGAYTRLLASTATRSSGQGMLLFGSTIKVSSWASDTSTGISSSANYVAVAMQYQVGSGAGMATSTGNYITKSPNNSGQYLTIGRTDTDADTQNAEPANLYLRYFAVSSAYETEQQIRTNLANLESVFIQ